ncbi:hypothetical protein CH267_00905 [Rhodococcus sp. 06-621-2]|nr:hypothetical protein CH267_00905 [Rhodococcus sp. 06-621-2]
MPSHVSSRGIAGWPEEWRQVCDRCRHFRGDHVQHAEGGIYCWSRDNIDGWWCECTEFKEAV